MAFRPHGVVKGVGIGRMFLILVLLFVTGFTAFPAPWNNAMRAIHDKIGFSLPTFSDGGFTLGLDLQGGVHLVYEADMTSIAEADRASALEGVRDVIERRANALGVSEARVETTTVDGHYRVIIELPGLQDATAAMARIGETPVLEFKTPTKEVTAEPTVEEKAQIADDQEVQREAALAVLDRALDGEDFAALAAEFSTDSTTKDSAGYIGFVYNDDSVYGELVQDFTRRTKTGVIDGLYESESDMHVMQYLSSRTEDEVTASHLLICWAGATNCTSDMTKEEALAKIAELKSQATTENFADLVVANSTEPGAAESQGNLGTVRKGVMVQPFEDALFAMEDGTISDVVETQFGYHLIFRSESEAITAYELAHIQMDWTTASDVVDVDPWENTTLSGKHIRRASVGFDTQTSVPYVMLDFNSEGAELFADLTEARVGEVIGIFLDGEAVTTPIVNQAIYGGQAQITGNFTVQEAKLLAQRLNAGALPVPINPVSQQTVGPTLGQASLDASVQAALIGFLLISLFMIVYYRLPGLLAVLALVVYTAINLAIYKWFGVTLTLSGIAGFVLSMGIAVDANVLIFERMKEELRSGRDVPSSVVEAVQRAWPSIRDGNATTLIATFVLYNMVQASFVRGFAITLAAGILVSIFCAMVITRWLLLWVSRAKVFRKPLFFLGLHK